MEIIWALPWSASADVLPSPLITVMSAPVLQPYSDTATSSNSDGISIGGSSDPWQSCAAGARPIAAVECGPSAGGAMCPSNQCCGPLPRDVAIAVGLEALIGNRSYINVCAHSKDICTVGWAGQVLLSGYGRGRASATRVGINLSLTAYRSVVVTFRRAVRFYQHASLRSLHSC